jgi:hypothetical protein
MICPPKRAAFFNCDNIPRVTHHTHNRALAFFTNVTFVPRRKISALFAKFHTRANLANRGAKIVCETLRLFNNFIRKPLRRFIPNPAEVRKTIYKPRDTFQILMHDFILPQTFIRCNKNLKNRLTPMMKVLYIDSVGKNGKLN